MAVRWLALWLILTCIYVGGWAVSRWWAGGGWALTPEILLHFALVPPVQVFSLWVVAAARQPRRTDG
jgi:hypothetical protein